MAAEIYEEAGVGLTWIHSSVDNVESRNEDGEMVGSVANGSDAIFFAFAKKFAGNAHLGIGVEYFESSIENVTASSAGFGAGVSYRIVHPDVTVGVALQHMFMSYRWNSNNYYSEGQTVEEQIPPLVRVGLACNFKLFGREGSAVADLQNYPTLGEFKYGIGAEISVFPQLDLRGGFNGESPTFGVGIHTRVGKINSVGIDYAFVPDKLGLSPRHVLDLVVHY